MTTLRRVLLQSAKEAGPVEGPSSSHRPSTPHAGKSTPRRPSPHLSASDDDSAEDDNVKHHSASEKKHHLSKRRRTSRGWDDVSEKDSEKSPKTTKGHDSTEVTSIKSPRMGSKTNSSSSLVSSSTLSKSPKSSTVSSPTTQVSEKPSNSTIPAALPPPPPPPPPPPVEEEEPVKKEKETTTRGAVAMDELDHTRSLTDAHHTVSTTKRPTRTPSPPVVVAKDALKDVPRGERQVSVSSSASAAPVSRQASGKSSSSGSSSLVTHAVIAQEWVQCEDCKKWRKLPLNIAASSLPESWFCRMNTWNTALASCEASVEEGSEETTEDPSSNAAGGRTDVGSSNGTVGIGAGGGKRNTALPPGINLYGGQVQPPPLTLGPSGAKQPRFSTYRDLIGAHYRNNKLFMNTFNSTCDARYGAFPTYVSNSLKPRAFDHKSTLLAFPKLGWMVSNCGTDSMAGGVKCSNSIMSPSFDNNTASTPSPTAGPSNFDNSSNPLPPKMLFKTFANKS